MIRHSFFFSFGGARRHIVIVRVCTRAQRSWKQTPYYAIYVYYMKWRKLNKFPFAYCQFIAFFQTWTSLTQILKAVTRKLCAIIPKDHTLAPVSQGTKAMDTIVQVKYFNFLVFLVFFFFNPFKSVRLGWEVTDVMFWNQCEKGNVF